MTKKKKNKRENNDLQMSLIQESSDKLCNLIR